MATKRRSSGEVKKLAHEAKALVDGGMPIAQASKQVGISDSIYYRIIEGYKPPGAKKRAKKKAHRETGRMDVRSLPPRPKKNHGGARKARPLDMMNMGALAARIASIDKKLAKVENLQRDREHFVKALMKLLNGKPGH